MSGLEPIIAAEAAAATTAAATATAAETIAAATAAAEAAAAAETAAAVGSTLEGAAAAELANPLQAAVNESIAQANLLDSANLYSQMGLPDPFENFLRYGVDADMPGATMRSIQSGLQNAPLNTIRNLPQFMGAPAMPQGLSTGLQAARLAATPPQGQRTSYSPPQMNRGRQVTLAEPVLSLLQNQPMRRRKDMLSLI